MKLEEFSMQLMHTKADFTVLDIFSLDNSLLLSVKLTFEFIFQFLKVFNTLQVVGSVTTYIVIIIQFQKDN